MPSSQLFMLHGQLSAVFSFPLTDAAFTTFSARQAQAHVRLRSYFFRGLYNLPPRLFLTRHSHFTEFGFWLWLWPPRFRFHSLARCPFQALFFHSYSVSGDFPIPIFQHRVFFTFFIFILFPFAFARDTCERRENDRRGCLLAFKVHRKLISFRFHKKSQWNFRFTLPFAIRFPLRLLSLACCPCCCCCCCCCWSLQHFQ